MVKVGYTIFLLLLSIMSGNAQNNFAKAVVSRSEGFVGQELKITITVYAEGSFTSDLTIGKITTDKAMIIPFTNNIEVGSANVKGVLYSTLLFTYKVYPYASGTITFPKVKITGDITSPGDLLGSEKTLYSNVVSINIIPLPGGNSTSAFVSNRVVLSEKWTKLKDTMMTGEISYRTLTVFANNTIPTFIDSISIPNVDFAKEYMKSDDLNQNVNYNTITGERKDSYLYLFMEEGTFDLPEAEIVYFNPFLKKYVTVQTKTKTITIIPNPNQAILTSLSDSLKTAYNSATTKKVELKKDKPFNKKKVLMYLLWVVIAIVIITIITKLIAYNKNKRAIYKTSLAYSKDQMYAALKAGNQQKFINLFYVYILKGSKHLLSFNKIKTDENGDEVVKQMEQIFNNKYNQKESAISVDNAELLKSIKKWGNPKKINTKKKKLRELYPA